MSSARLRALWPWRALFLVLSVTAFYWQRPQIGPDDTGVIVLVRRLCDILTFTGWSITMILVGLLVLQILRVQQRQGGLELGVSLVAGTALTGGLFLLLGLAGFLESALVRALASLGLASLLWTSAVDRGIQAIRDINATLRETFTGPSGRVAAVVTACTLLLLGVIALGPLTAWDGAMYHVDLPWEFLADGRVFLPSDNTHVAFLSAPQMAMVVPLASGSVASLALSQWLSLVAVVVVAGEVAHRHLGRHSAQLAILLTGSATGLTMVSTVHLVDSSMVLGVFALTAWVADIRFTDHADAPAFLGLLAGAALMTKYQAAPYVLGVLVLYLAIILSGRVRLSLVGHTGGLLLLLVITGPLLLKNWLLLGAPNYPFPFQLPYPSWVMQVDGYSETALPSGSVLVSVRSEFTVRDWIFDPGVLTVEDAGRWLGFPLTFLLGFGAMFTRYWRLALFLVVPVAVGITAILLVSSTTNLRYLLPFVPVFAVLTALVTALVGGENSTVRLSVLAALALLALSTLGAWAQDTIGPAGSLQVALGTESEEEWAARPANASQRNVRNVAALLSGGQAPDAPTLLLYEARGFHFSTPVIQDNSVDNWPTLYAITGGECPDASVFAKVVLASDTLQYYIRRGASEEELRLDELESFIDECLVLEASPPGYLVFRTRVEAAG